MKLVRKISELRHFVALLVLAIGMSVFAAGAGKAAVDSKRIIDDPVIGSMSWEQTDTDGNPTYGTLGDGPYALCNPNCPNNCDINCDGNCDANCNGNCPRKP